MSDYAGYEKVVAPIFQVKCPLCKKWFNIGKGTNALLAEHMEEIHGLLPLPEEVSGGEVLFGKPKYCGNGTILVTDKAPGLV